MFRWDSNIRESTILSLVCAGDVSIKLKSFIDTLEPHPDHHPDQDHGGVSEALSNSVRRALI